MEETGRIEIHLLSESDIPAAMQLKELARWNQTESDWRCLLRLEPQGCFGAFLNGRLVGTTTTTTYDRELAWIGMVLVNPENRRCGIATRLIKTALDYLSEKVTAVKLDATPEGQPVYEKFGFEVESVIERWVGIARAAPPDRANEVETTAKLDSKTRRELIALDRRAFCADRSRLIETLINNAYVSPVFTRSADGRLSGYALGRRGTNADYIGPLVSTDAEQTPHLLDGVLKQLEGNQIYVDANSGLETGARVLADRGFLKQRDLIRLFHGTRNSVTSPWIFAIAGPEVG
jgi:GNAT superfamily N-acetyltransferase